jgi:hypothetical protein
MRQRGWQVSFPHSLAIVQITYSEVMLCPSLSEVECFHAVWNKILLESFNVFYASQKCTLLKFYAFGALKGYFTFLLLQYYVTSYWNKISILCCKCIPVFVTILSVQINHKHPGLYCTLQYEVNSEYKLTSLPSAMYRTYEYIEMLVNRHIKYHGFTLTATVFYISDQQHTNTILVTSFDIP